MRYSYQYPPSPDYADLLRQRYPLPLRSSGQSPPSHSSPSQNSTPSVSGDLHHSLPSTHSIRFTHRPNLSPSQPPRSSPPSTNSRRSSPSPSKPIPPPSYKPPSAGTSCIAPLSTKATRHARAVPKPRPARRSTALAENSAHKKALVVPVSEINPHPCSAGAQRPTAQKPEISLLVSRRRSTIWRFGLRLAIGIDAGI